jgi:hypothetical protein
MKSVAQTVSGKVHVWAIPKNPDYDDMDGGPFKYEITSSGSYHWKTGAVCILDHDIVVDVPEGIDLISKAFDTLNAAKVQAQVDYNQRIMELDKQIHQLLMLTHQPEPKPEDNDHDLVGEIIDERDPFDVVDAEVIEPELVKDELDHICDYRGADHE